MRKTQHNMDVAASNTIAYYVADTVASSADEVRT